MTISKDVAFKLELNGPVPAAADRLAVPDGLKALICRQISPFFDVELVAENVQVDSKTTLGALAIRDGVIPVIFEFRNDTHENIVERTDNYHHWLLENPQALHYAIRRVTAFGTEVADKISYENLEMVSIAASFSDDEVEFARVMQLAGEKVKLFRALRLDDDHIVFVPVNIEAQRSAEMGRFRRTQTDAASIAKVTNVPEDELQAWLAERIQIELREGLQREFREQAQAFGFHATEELYTGAVEHTFSEPTFSELSLDDLDLSILEDLPADTPRSTRFLHLLRVIAEQVYDEPIEQYPGKTTLRIPRPEIGPGCELVYGVRRHDARVEWYIPKNHATATLLDAVDAHWDTNTKLGDTYERAENDYAVRVYRLSTIPVGWDDLESLWPTVIDDLDDIMSIFEMSIGDFYLSAFGSDPFTPA